MAKVTYEQALELLQNAELAARNEQWGSCAIWCENLVALIRNNDDRMVEGATRKSGVLDGGDDAG